MTDFTTLLNLGDRLPNYQKETVIVNPDEYVTDISINRAAKRLLENDLYLYQKTLGLEEVLATQIEINSNINTTNWDSCYSTVHANSAVWDINQEAVVASTIPTAGSYIPLWDNGIKSINKGLQVADSSNLNITNDITIPTTKYVNDAITDILVSTSENDRVMQLEVTPDVPAPTPGNIAVWYSDKIIKDSGYNINSFRIFESMWRIDYVAGTGGKLTEGTVDVTSLTLTQYVCPGGYTRVVRAIPNDGYTFVKWTGTKYSKSGIETVEILTNPLKFGDFENHISQNVYYSGVFTAIFSNG